MTGSRDVVVFSPEALQPYGHCHDYVRGLGAQLAARGWRVAVVAWEGPLSLPGVLETVPVPRPALWSLPRSHFRRRWSPLLGDVLWGLIRVRAERRLVGALQRELRRRPEAAVIYESFEYLGLARHLRRDGSRRARLTILHDAGFNTQHASPVAGAYKSLVRRAVRRIAAHSSFVLVHGVAMKGALESNLGLTGALAERVRVIPYGAPGPGDVTTAEPAEARAALGLAPAARVALAFGTLRRDKRFDYVLEALSQAPHWTLLVAGPEGDLTYDEFLAMVRRAGLGDRVILHRGFIGPDRQPLYFGAAEVVLAIYDSRIRHESGTGQLARAFRRPVIVSGGPDLAAYVRETGCGWTADAGDSASLAAALRHLEGMDPAGRAALEARLEHAAQARSWRAVAATVEGLLAEAAVPAGR